MAEPFAPVADAELIRQTAEKVLQDPDYNLRSARGLLAAWDWFLDLLRPVADFLDSLYDISPALFFLVMALLIISLVALVVHIAYSFSTAMRRRQRAALYQQMEDSASTRPETWEERARNAFEDGDYLHAVRFILTSTLLRLEAARKGRLRRGATNREYLRRYRQSPAYVPLSEIVEITDSRWYGGVNCSRADVETCFRAHQQIREILMTSEAHAQQS